jgi:diaminobutyrate-2-oxoglutarate transaminase
VRAAASFFARRFNVEVFERLESNVRGYCRSWPTVFTQARGAEIWDENGRGYIDLFAGAGALNYGHNHPALKAKLIEYLGSDGVTHSLDMATSAKRALLLALERYVLEPRGMRYKIQFPGPTGTNAVEAALKLARKVTRRHNVVAFTNAFHGMTLGALSVTGNHRKRQGAGVPLEHVTTLPYAGYLEGGDGLGYFEALLRDKSSGLDKPAAVILETIQAEGGVNVAPVAWLQRLRELTASNGIVLVVDDIQVGCGRTGTFFSFEHSGIEPDIICLSKSLSGYGLPLSIVLIRPELDQWAPSEHNGTFRGHNLAFVTATAALELFWSNDEFAQSIAERAEQLDAQLGRWARYGKVKGRGLIRGIELPHGAAEDVAREAFARGVLIETAGAQDEVLKFLPPLVIEPEQLKRALSIIDFVLRRRFGTRHVLSSLLPPEPREEQLP